MISDRGSIFTSEIWKELFKCLRSTQNLSSSYHPQTDGLSEKMNDSVEVCLRAFTNYLQDNWNVYLPDIELGMNTSKSDSSGLTPHEIDTGSLPFMPLGIADHLVTKSESNPEDINSFITKLNLIMNRTRIMMLESQEQSALYANKHRTDIEFKEGDYVMLNAEFVSDPIHLNRPSRKFSDKWLGPFKIIKRISRVSYKLFIPDSEKILVHIPVVHVSNLKLFNDTPERFLNREIKEDPPAPILDEEGGTEFLVDEILAWRMYRNKRQFLIKWTGYELPSWESEYILLSSPDFIKFIYKNLLTRIYLCISQRKA